MPEAVKQLVSEMLILPDGQILVHNLTPQCARLLDEILPGGDQIHPRNTIIRVAENAKTNDVALRSP